MTVEVVQEEASTVQEGSTSPLSMEKTGNKEGIMSSPNVQPSPTDQSTTDQSPEPSASKDVKKFKATVKFFNLTKGFGFLTTDDGEEIFVHHVHVKGNLLKGEDVVSYTLGQDESGRPMAINVEGGTGEPQNTHAPGEKGRGKGGKSSYDVGFMKGAKMGKAMAMKGAINSFKGTFGPSWGGKGQFQGKSRYNVPFNPFWDMSWYVSMQKGKYGKGKGKGKKGKKGKDQSKGEGKGADSSDGKGEPIAISVADATA